MERERAANLIREASSHILFSDFILRSAFDAQKVL